MHKNRQIIGLTILKYKSIQKMDITGKYPELLHIRNTSQYLRIVRLDTATSTLITKFFSASSKLSVT